ncbi:hypothetical protein SAMN04489716_0787 [Actinoplanes derwentensis]|uniref:SUKH-4 immunity protein n=1 Tax=Actinoplanes derwentensis TaxID=113562 RepID=A0A1H1S760_9ACTN|nr:hypothetical protein SAMN04489716_0787 [Actinoplanes derwentensis]
MVTGFPRDGDRPSFGELEAWAGKGRVRRAAASEVANWRLSEADRAALTESGVPLFDELVHGESFRAMPGMYRLAYYEGTYVNWDYGVLPGSGEVRRWERDGTSQFVNSSVVLWLCSLQMVGGWFTRSTAIHHWDENGETEDQARAEIDDLLGRIGVADPAAIGDGSHETHFWPAVLDRWMY